jgi:atypical dual specificity phosphatase
VNTEQLALTVTLGVIGCGLIGLIWSLMRRNRRRREAENRPIDVSLFNRSTSAAPLRSEPDRARPQAAGRSFAFRQRAGSAPADIVIQPNVPAISFLEDGTERDEPVETLTDVPYQTVPESEAVVEVSIPTVEPVLICTHYGAGFGSKVVLDDISLDIPARGITVLMGPAGTGKSTFLRSLAGLYAQNALYKCWGEVSYRDAPAAPGNQPLLVAQRIQLTQRSALESLTFHIRDQMEDASDEEKREWAIELLRRAGAEQIIPKLDTPFMELDALSQRIVTVLREAVAASGLLMIDEPTTGLSESDADILLTLLQTMAQSTALLIVLHNQKQARKISDKVVLLAGGYVQAQCSPDEFFSGASENPVVAQFVTTGSCAVPSPGMVAEMLAEDVPPPPPLTAAAMAAIKTEVRAALAPAPELAAERAAVKRYPGNSSGPRGFIWIEEGRLAATPMPGVSADMDYDLDLLKSVGITALISLTERDFPQDALARHSLTNLHMPIEDRKAPTPAEMDALVMRMRQMLDNGEVLAVHCLAGLGRTGTILAAYLVKEKGLSAQSALNQIRYFNRQFVQSDDQEDFLMEYEVQHEQSLLRGHASDSTRVQ